MEPFYARTIATGATHSLLKQFYQDPYNSLQQDKVDSTFILMEKPFFPGVSEDLFAGVKASYGEAVLQSVVDCALEHEEDTILLLNMMLPGLATTLARQRRDYGLDDTFPAEFPVEEQASRVDDTPVHNLDMERLMGRTDHRLHKLQRLSAASRSIILRRTKALREASSGPSFRSYKEIAEKKREKELEWNKRQESKFRGEAIKKQQVAISQERNRIQMLEQLKEVNGPFTNAEDVEAYINCDAPEKSKQSRMKLEVKFARESSTTLPRVDPLFRIQVGRGLSGRRREKTAQEFAEALAVFLGRKSDRTFSDYAAFSHSLREILGGE